MSAQSSHMDVVVSSTYPPLGLNEDQDHPNDHAILHHEGSDPMPIHDVRSVGVGAGGDVWSKELPAFIAGELIRSSDTLTGDYDVGVEMRRLVDACLRLVPDAEISVSLRRDDGLVRVIAASSGRKRVLEQYQFDRDCGPSVEAFQTGKAPGRELITDHEYPWPSFAELAQAVGYTVVRSIPLRSRDETVGVLSIAETAEATRPPLQDAFIQTLAEGATIGYLNYRRLAVSHELSRQLQTALTTRVVIEQAKGIVAARLSVNLDQAFEALRGYARSTSRKLHDVSSSVIDGVLSVDELSEFRRSSHGRGHGGSMARRELAAS